MIRKRKANFFYHISSFTSELNSIYITNKMKRRKQILILIGCIAAAFQLQAQNTVMSLKDAINYALKDNTDIKKQNLTVLESRQRVLEGYSQALPQISGTAQLNNNLQIQQQLLPGEILGQPGTFVPVKFGVQYNIPLLVRADQLLYDQAYLVGLNQAKAAEALTKVQTENVTQDVIYNVSVSYFQTMLLGEQSVLIAANLETVKQSLAVVQSQYDNQMTRKIDLDQLKVTQSNTQNDYYNSQINFGYSLDQLKIILGYPLADTLILNEDFSTINYKVTSNNVIANPTLSLLDQQAVIKRLDIKSVNANYAPSLTAFAQYGYQSQFNNWTSSEMQWNSNSMVGLQLSVPIFDGLQKSHQVKQRKLQLESVLLDRQLAEKALNAQYDNAVRKYLQNEQSVENQKANLALAQNVYDAIQNNYKNSLASLSDLINADTGLKTAQSSYLTSLLQKRISALDILKANGNMTSIIN